MNNKVNKAEKTKKVSLVRKGFTLVELMVVVAIIGIGATVSFSGAGPGSFFKTDAQMKQVKARFHNAIKTARALAILSRKDICIQNVVAGNEATMTYCPGTDPNTPGANQITAAQGRAFLMLNKLTTLMNKPVKLPSGSISIDNTPITFNRLGMISSKKSFIFKNDKDGDIERYIVDISIAGTSKSCKENTESITTCN